MEILLLVGLIGLAAAHIVALWRLGRVERQLGTLLAAPAAAPGERPLPGEQAAAAPAGEPAAPPTLAGLFETLVGGRLLIWIGGIAFATAGIFLIRHSIALISPEVRMIGAALFGVALIAAGEYARGGRLLADDPRIGQALVGAGIAVLYATVYGSYLLFGLLGSGSASGLMLLITAAGLILSLRHGAPTAFMGLVGGLLTPLLVGEPQAGALPVLLYLALLDAAIFAIAWRRRWGWLAAAAIAGSFAWSGYFLLEPPADALPAGIFAGILGIAASLPRGTEGKQLSFVQPAILALAQTAVLVARHDVGVEAWLVFGAVAAATLPLSIVRPATRFAPAAAAGLALALIGFRSLIDQDPFVTSAALAATLLFGFGSIALPGREGALRAATACAGLAGPHLILRALEPGMLSSASWGGLALLLAAAALILSWLIRRSAAAGAAPSLGAFFAGATAALLLGAAAYDLVPRDFVSGGWLLIAVALLLVGIRGRDKALRLAGLLMLTATITRVFLIDAAALEGVLRILSFLALGAALIWIGRFYPRVLNAERKKPG